MAWTKKALFAITVVGALGLAFMLRKSSAPTTLLHFSGPMMGDFVHKGVFTDDG